MAHLGRLLGAQDGYVAGLCQGHQFPNRRTKHRRSGYGIPVGETVCAQQGRVSGPAPETVTHPEVPEPNHSALLGEGARVWFSGPALGSDIDQRGDAVPIQDALDLGQLPATEADRVDGESPRTRIAGMVIEHG